MTPPSDKEQIDALFHALVKAHHDRDAAAIVAAYCEDALVYDLAPPLARRGLRREEVEKWLDSWDGPIKVEARDEELFIEARVAVATALTRFTGLQGGVEQDIWFRSTTCLRKGAHGWRIVHEHSSVPFYMDGSNRAAIDLKP